MLCKVDELKEKEYFYYELKNEWDMNNIDYLVVCLGNISGHVSSLDFIAVIECIVSVRAI